MGHGVISAKKRQLLHDGISQVCAAPHIQIHDMNLDGLMRVKAFASQALDKRRLIKLIPGAGTIMGGAAAGTAAALTLALGKAYIGICKAIKMRRLDLNELSQKKGREAFKQAFRDEMKQKKQK